MFPLPPNERRLSRRSVLLQITVIESLIEKSDVILLGGAMIFTFYKAQGLSVGKSLVREGPKAILLADKIQNTAMYSSATEDSTV